MKFNGWCKYFYELNQTTYLLRFFQFIFLLLATATFLFAVSQNINAAELVDIDYTPATKEKPGNCPRGYPATATLSPGFQHGLSGRCYSCPKGYVRNVTDINSSNACIKVELNASYSKATKHAKDSAAFLDIGRREWWKCPSGYPRRTLYPVDHKYACATKALWPDEKLTKATYLGKENAYPKRPAHAFWDIGKSNWYSCPTGYFRTLTSVDSNTACRKAPVAQSARATNRGARGCPSGAFAHGLNGDCYSCPTGYERSLAIGDDLSKLPEACVKVNVDVAGFLNDQVKNALLGSLSEMGLPSSPSEVTQKFGQVVNWLDQNGQTIDGIVSDTTSKVERANLAKQFETFFSQMGNDLVTWNPKSASLGLAADASYGVGYAVTKPMVAWKLNSNLQSLNDWGLYWAANGLLGATAGVNVAPEIGLWTPEVDGLDGPAIGISFGGSVKVGFSVTYWWGLPASTNAAEWSAPPPFLGMTVTLGFGVGANANMLAGYTQNLGRIYQDGFTAATTRPPSPAINVTSQPPAVTVNEVIENDSFVPDGLWLDKGWQNYGGPFQPARVIKSTDGRVTLEGLIHAGSLTDTIGILSPGYRPKQQLVFDINHHDKSMRVDVLPTGEVQYVAGGKDYGWLNLSGISFDTRDTGYKNLSLANGWRPYGGAFGTPKYKVDKDWVTLSGLITMPGRHQLPIAVLPVNARPLKRLIFNINSHGNTGRIDVLPDGQVLWVAGVSKHRWLSLEGIRFKHSKSRSQYEQLTMGFGWSSYGEDYMPPTVTKAGKTVAVYGLAKVRPNNSNNVIAILRPEYRPSHTQIFNVNNHGKAARVDVRKNGEVVWIAGGKDHNWVSLSGISFETGVAARTTTATRADPTATATGTSGTGANPSGTAAGGTATATGANPTATAASPTTTGANPVASASQFDYASLPLGNGWGIYGGAFDNPSYSKHGDVITLAGLAKRPKVGAGLIAQLPKELAPEKTLTFNVNNHESTVRVDVLKDGRVVWIAGGDKHGWVSLAGIQYNLTKATPLPLAPGWSAYGSHFATAGYSKQSNLVSLSGLIKGNSWGHLATLPADVRPKQKLIFNVNNHGKTARVDITPDGKVSWRAGGKDYGWISLAGIQYPLGGVYGPLPLTNGWQPYGGGFQEPSFSKQGTLVILSGLAKGNRWGHIATLPRGYRPNKTLVFNMNNHEKTARIDVKPDGRVIWIAGGKDHGWVSLSGITFPAAQ